MTRMQISMPARLLAGVVALASVALASGVPEAQAQELAGSFDQLRVLVKTGDTVRVTGGSGQEVRGTIAALSSSTLELVVAGSRRVLTESDVDSISQRRPDSLSNGARWGFGIGAGFGLLTGLAIEAEYREAAVAVPLIAALYGGIGAGIGVGFDAMISGNRVIYSRHPPPASRRSSRVTLTPMLSRGRVRVTGSIAF